MAVYSFRCGSCGARAQLSSPIGTIPPPPVHACLGLKGRDTMMRRDYQADLPDFGNAVQVKREREAGGREAVRDLFLPTAKDFAGPGDPDGSKGIRAWNDEHDP